MLSPDRPQKQELLDNDGLPLPPRPPHICLLCDEDVVLDHFYCRDHQPHLRTT